MSSGTGLIFPVTTFSTAFSPKSPILRRPDRSCSWLVPMTGRRHSYLITVVDSLAIRAYCCSCLPPTPSDRLAEYPPSIMSLMRATFMVFALKMSIHLVAKAVRRLLALRRTFPPFSASSWQVCSLPVSSVRGVVCIHPHKFLDAVASIFPMVTPSYRFESP